jgi:hypothetical protein
MKKSSDGQTPHALIIRRQRQVPLFSSHLAAINQTLKL